MTGYMVMVNNDEVYVVRECRFSIGHPPIISYPYPPQTDILVPIAGDL